LENLPHIVHACCALVTARVFRFVPAGMIRLPALTADYLRWQLPLSAIGDA
jgi:hypothetical protein